MNAPTHYVAFIGPAPERAADIIAVTFHGDELPLPQITTDRLRSVLDAGLTRCTLAIALAVGLLPCRGEA